MRAPSPTWTADNGDGTFTNPLFFDEFSDPDLIRVGDDFYLTGTTMHAMPGLPVLHSTDLVNWRFLSYACERLDFGPEYRLEDGREIYGQGIWAPSFRHHRGAFLIFANVRGQPMQVFRATDPAGPWTRTAMQRAFHDPSVLFDDDGKTWIVWGYRDLRIAQLDDALQDVVPGTERVVIPVSAGMGEGAHFLKIDGRYYIFSAWYLGTMKMPCARAAHPEGPYEVRDISFGEDFGIATGAIHQGGIVDTPAGEWWGYSMMDFNAVGRLTALSPVTWKDGWPWFGLPGNLGASPRTWVKPRTARPSRPHAPFTRGDDFSGPRLNPLWQWNHAPVDAKWSLAERPGRLRLHALPAPDFWNARNTLTQRTVGPEATYTTLLEVDGLRSGDVAGLGLLNAPYAWIGVRPGDDGPTVEQFDQGTGRTARALLRGRRVWLRAACDFATQKARFSFSADGRRFTSLGAPFAMVYQLKTFQGVRTGLFCYNERGADGGYADFDRMEVAEPRPRGRARPIPKRRTVVLTEAGGRRVLAVRDDGRLVAAAGEPAARFVAVDRGQGRVSLRVGRRYVTVSDPDGREAVRLAAGAPSDAQTFQWIDTFPGELTLLSLATHRYLRLRPDAEGVTADAPGPRRRRNDGCRFMWELAPPRSA